MNRKKRSASWGKVQEGGVCQHPLLAHNYYQPATARGVVIIVCYNYGTNLRLSAKSHNIGLRDLGTSGCRDFCTSGGRYAGQKSTLFLLSLIPRASGYQISDLMARSPTIGGSESLPTFVVQSSAEEQLCRPRPTDIRSGQQ